MGFLFVAGEDGGDGFRAVEGGDGGEACVGHCEGDEMMKRVSRIEDGKEVRDVYNGAA